MNIPDTEDRLEKLKAAFVLELRKMVQALTESYRPEDPSALLNSVHQSAVEFFNAFERSLDEYTLPSVEMTNEIAVRKAEDTINVVDTLLGYWGTAQNFCAKYSLPELKPSVTAYATMQRVVARFYPQKKNDYEKRFQEKRLPTHGFISKRKHSGWKPTSNLRIEITIGIPILATTLLVAFLVPVLTGFQYFILRLFMALGITLVGSALIEGTASINLNTKIGMTIRATGWMAIFIILYLLNPPPPPSPGSAANYSRVAVVELLENGTDLHLGDNVYPSEYGYSYNPLNQAVYQQGISGIIYYDKETREFLPDKGKPTIVGQALVDFLAGKIGKLDFSSWKYVRAFSPQDSQFAYYSNLGGENTVLLGPTLLVAKDSLWGNFYERYAAVGFVKAFGLAAECARHGIDVEDSSKIAVSVLMHCYHGGIRPSQTENFYVQFNEYSAPIESKTQRMRDPQEMTINIPSAAVSFSRENILFIYVLPWTESRPTLKVKGRTVFPVHFRDIGISRLEIMAKQ